MISGGKSIGETTLVFDKTAEINLPPRLLEIRQKIQSQEYVDNAIQRIAQVISNHLIEDSGELVGIYYTSRKTSGSMSFKPA